VLSIIVGPLTPSRLLLAWSMALAFLLVMVLPATRQFFALVTPPAIVWLASFGIAALVWSLSRLFIPPHHPGRPGGRGAGNSIPALRESSHAPEPATIRLVTRQQPVFGRILAGTDGSERAEEAVGRAGRLASLDGLGHGPFVVGPASFERGRTRRSHGVTQYVHPQAVAEWTVAGPRGDFA